jgi:tetratricopeptide (TPR) repeat protein
MSSADTETAPPIFIHDLHDGAYYDWCAARRTPLPLVHLDAHHDLEPIGRAGVHIGNFVRRAALDGLIKRVFWVVPDPVWRSAPSRAVLARELRAIADGSPVRWAAKVAGLEVVVCSLSDVPRIEEPVWLDIDLDYLVTSERGRGAADRTGVPWIWPEALVREIAGRDWRYAGITIATSVTGGFTPIGWKHLAHELEMRLRGGKADEQTLLAYALVARAATRDPAECLAELRRGAELHPSCPPVLFHLANALLGAGRLEDARAAFGRAVALDPEYRHPYRSRGPREQAAGRLSAARAEYQRVQLLDPFDPFSRIGLAQLAEQAGRREESQALFEEALALPGGDLIEACRGLARVIEGADPDRAVRMYERSLKLALAGQVPLSAPLCTNQDRRRMDPAHADTYGRIGRLLERAGHDRSAMLNYLLAAGTEPRYRVRLGRLRLRKLRLRGLLDCLLGSAEWLSRAAGRATASAGRPWYNPGPP